MHHTKNNCKKKYFYFILHHDLSDGKVTNLEAVYKMTYFKIKTVISQKSSFRTLWDLKTDKRNGYEPLSR